MIMSEVRIVEQILTKVTIRLEVEFDDREVAEIEYYMDPADFEFVDRRPIDKIPDPENPNNIMLAPREDLRTLSLSGRLMGSKVLKNSATPPSPSGQGSDL